MDCRNINRYNNKMKNQYKILTTIFLFLLVLPLINSQNIYKAKDSIDIKIPFEVDGEAASSSATCNLSIQYPNSTYLISDGSMTNLENGEFNYTLSTTETNLLGQYNWVAYCCDGTKCAAGYDSFELTPSGTELSIAQGIIYVIFLIIAFFIFWICIYGSFKIKWRNDVDETGKVVSVNDFKWLKLFLMVFSYLTFMFIMAMTYNITENFIYLGNVSSYFHYVYLISLSVFFPIMVLMPWVVLYIVFQDKKVKKLIQRGLPTR